MTFEEDLAVSLADRREKLKNVVFQKDIGTYYSKTERVKNIVLALGEMTGEVEAAKIAAEAAALSRSDLTTAMVFEFPELQGVMGRVYAEKVDKRSHECALAIEEMYKPRSAGDDLPRTLPGALLSIADKIDTIIGCVFVGLAPTGSADPYMLRRQTFGLLKTILKFDLRFKLSDLAVKTLSLLKDDSEDFRKNLTAAMAAHLKIEEVVQENEISILADSWFGPQAGSQELEKQLTSLFQGRFETVLKDEGISYDIIQAVFGAPWPGVTLVYRKAKELQEMKNDAEFGTLCNMLTRCVNIAKDVKKGKAADAVDPALFETPEEKKLWAKWQTARKEAKEELAAARFGAAAKKLASDVAAPLDAFFTNVRIYADDKAVASNRLAILKDISETIRNEIADLSKIVTA